MRDIGSHRGVTARAGKECGAARVSPPLRQCPRRLNQFGRFADKYPARFGEERCEHPLITGKRRGVRGACDLTFRTATCLQNRHSHIVLGTGG